MDKYIVNKEVGSGTYGVIYIGKRKETNEDIIIKKIDYSILEEDSVRIIKSEVIIIFF